jgi:hypothetical protein
MAGVRAAVAAVSFGIVAGCAAGAVAAAIELDGHGIAEPARPGPAAPGIDRAHEAALRALGYAR